MVPHDPCAPPRPMGAEARAHALLRRPSNHGGGARTHRAGLPLAPLFSRAAVTRGLCDVRLRIRGPPSSVAPSMSQQLPYARFS